MVSINNGFCVEHAHDMLRLILILLTTIADCRRNISAV